jgi:hypothetical protein
LKVATIVAGCIDMVRVMKRKASVNDIMAQIV